MIKVSTNNNKNGLAYSSKDINRNFRIKVSGVDAQGRKVHKLVGVAGAIDAEQTFEESICMHGRCLCLQAPQRYQVFFLLQIIRNRRSKL